MKRFISTILALVLAAPGVWASADLVTQRAKRQRDMLNAQQGVAPATPTPRGGGQPAAATPQGISQSQLQLIGKLQTDLTAFKAGKPITPELKQQLTNDFATLAKKAAKPSPPALEKLADDLSAALAEKRVSFNAQAQLAKDINIVVNSVNLSTPQVLGIVDEAQTMLKGGGVPELNASTVGADLKAIVTELQKSKSIVY